jgi:hypothetical protein
MTSSNDDAGYEMSSTFSAVSCREPLEIDPPLIIKSGALRRNIMSMSHDLETAIQTPLGLHTLVRLDGS